MILIAVIASAYLLLGAAVGSWLTRQLPRRHELRKRYAEISHIAGMQPSVLVYGTCVLYWPLVVARIVVWGWPKDENS